MKKNVVTAMLTMMVLMASLPMTALAEMTTIEPNDGDTANVIASADVTEADLEELGLNLVLSIPTSISLDLDEDKNFTGEDVVYAYGLMEEKTMLSVAVNDQDEDYGNVYFKKNADTEAVLFDNDFYNGSVIETLSSGTFRAEQTLANYMNMKESKDVEHKAVLSVSIDGMLPIYGVGDYYTNVPIVISFEDVQ
uniref:hypothetical protein n=1 Tax=Agathobacter sp. TaxID=2021311 RepID=UPI0040571F77